MARVLRTFPPEILSQIFAEATKYPTTPSIDAVRLSQVCHPWRQAAIGDSSLWLEIGINTRDVHHIFVITQLFQRSLQRTISVGMNFDEHPTSLEDGRLFRRLMILVSSHVCRARHLFIYAQLETWKIIAPAMVRQRFPNLSLLDLELIVPPIPGPLPASTEVRSFANGWPVAHRPPLPTPVVFPIPFNHPSLDRLRVKGISLSNTVFPNLELVRIGGNATRNLVGADGGLSRWLLQGPVSLYFEDLQIPPMHDYVEKPMDEREDSTITHLILGGLSATPRQRPDVEGSFEHDCWAFFDSLYTPLVRCLQIDGWDLNGRSWPDFLDWLPGDIRFPRLVDLRIFGMHLEGMEYRDVADFLGSFPRMRHLRLQSCLPGTWEIALEVLQMDATLCPKLKSIRLHDDLAILRNDPLPFAVEVVNEEMWTCRPKRP
ncbi:hypothetical protein C8R45DRAFT_1209144 [Mycena sanguinolenta]|nr:hypothetical protein C8R45DRAFT_1209144 [Mycena sanguinolenta]